MPVISAVCATAGEGAASLVAAPFDWLAVSMGNAAAWMFESVWAVFDSTTMVDVTSGQFTRVYNILFGVAVFVMLGFFMLQVIGAMIRREPTALSRAALGLAKSILGSFVALALIATALEVTDRISIGIVHAAGTNMDAMGERITLLASGIGSLQVAAPGAGAIITILVAGLALGAAVIVWLSLLIRKALLLIAIVFAPVALAGASWDQTRGWVSKWAAFVLALILSKIVLVVIFLLATAQVSAPIDSDLRSVSEPISGVVLMLMAGFAPYLTYKAIGFMGFDMHHAMSAEQEAKSALNRPIPIPMNRRLGQAPPAVLGGTNSGSKPGAPAPTPKPAGSGAAGGSAAAGGGVGAAAVAGVQTAKAGRTVGQAMGSSASRQADGAAPPQPAPPVPRLADPLADSPGTR
ncbi:conjugal transfer protein TrbL [Aeromicrobium sp. HA]|uniref:conjugal transfer protein TrbL n=1 Tax=Aeromicrobium sp. HA TaxID=3009077 RepID=UPI0022AF297E|nr:conjugal transfer protein TrbL [Aeromicrobium sp. HA]